MNNTEDLSDYTKAPLAVNATPTTKTAFNTTAVQVPLVPHTDVAALLNAVLMTYWEYRVAKSVRRYGYPVEVVLGSVCNLLALITMLGMSRLSTSNYMAALALADLSVVLGPGLVRWLLEYGLDPLASSTAVCRLLTFHSYWSYSLSAWILVAMTVDRYVAIRFPLKALRWSTPRRARFTVVVIMLVLAVVHSHFLFTLVVEGGRDTRHRACVGYDRHAYLLNIVWPWVDATIYSFLPFSFLVVFNVLIIHNYKKSLQVNVSLKERNLNLPAACFGYNRRLTLMLALVSLAFIVLTAPKALLIIIRPTVFDIKPRPDSLDIAVLARYTLTASLVNLLMFANHCVNFFFYCLAGQKFRQHLLSTVQFWKWRKRKRRVGVAIHDKMFNFNSRSSFTSTVNSSLVERASRSTKEGSSRSTSSETGTSFSHYNETNKSGGTGCIQEDLSPVFVKTGYKFHSLNAVMEINPTSSLGSVYSLTMK